MSSVIGYRYVKSNENKKILYKDADNLYGWAMSEYLPYDEINFDRNVQLEDDLNTPDDSDIGYFVEVDLKYRDNLKEKTKHFLFAPESKINHRDENNDYMKKIKPKNFTKTKKLKCDWSTKKN